MVFWNQGGEQPVGLVWVLVLILKSKIDVLNDRDTLGFEWKNRQLQLTVMTLWFNYESEIK